MSYRPNPDNQDWSTVRARLNETVAKWQRTSRPIDLTIDCQSIRRPATRFAEPLERAVTVTFPPKLSDKSARDLSYTVDRWPRPVDNLWALAVGLEQIRLNELRGLEDVVRQHYLQLAAPVTRDPYDHLSGSVPTPPLRWSRPHTALEQSSCTRMPAGTPWRWLN